MRRGGRKDEGAELRKNREWATGQNIYYSALFQIALWYADIGVPDTFTEPPFVSFESFKNLFSPHCCPKGIMLILVSYTTQD